MSEHDQPPVISEHASTRWDERASQPRPLDDVEPLDAWQQGTPIDADDARLRGCEARFHEPTHTVLVRRDDKLVTVLDSRTAKLAVKFAIHDAGCEP